MYRMFYNHAALGDVLIIAINPEARVDHQKENNNVVSLYDEKDNLVGINIFHIDDVMKIKANGVIFVPDEKMLEIINNILTKEGLSPLPLLNDSGYKVAEIISYEEHPLDEKAKIIKLKYMDKEYETVSRYPNIKEGSKVVVATDGTILYDGTLFHSQVIKNINNDLLILSPKELRISDKDKEAFTLDDDPSFSNGDDFFLKK